MTTQPTTDGRLTRLEAQTAILSAQVKSALMGNQAGADTAVTVLDILTNQAEMIEVLMGRVETLTERLGPLDANYRQNLHAAVAAVEAYLEEEQQPEWSDTWEVDQSKTDLTLTFRVEDKIVP